jgi:hypothetical protein
MPADTVPALPGELDEIVPAAPSLVTATAARRAAALDRLGAALGDLGWSALASTASAHTARRSRRPDGPGAYGLPGPSDLDALLDRIDGRLCLVGAEIGGSPVNVDELWLDRGNETRRLNPLRVESLLAAKGVLQLIQVDEAEPGLGRLAADLETAFAATAQANVFVSSSDESGTGRHRDNPELFIVQLLGPKRWTVHAPTAAHPTRATHRFATPQPGDLGEVEFDDVLEAGEVLFVPQGHWHLAEPVGARTVHATLGINRPAGYEFALWAQGVGMHQQVAMRRPLVTRTMQTAGADDSSAALAEQVEAWADPSTVERFTVHWLAQRPPRNATTSAAARAFMVGDAHLWAVCACPGGFHVAAATAETTRVWGGGKELLTGSGGVELLARLSAAGGVGVADLEPAEVEMVATLATAGLVDLAQKPS